MSSKYHYKHYHNHLNPTHSFQPLLFSSLSPHLNKWSTLIYTQNGRVEERLNSTSVLLLHFIGYLGIVCHCDGIECYKVSHWLDRNDEWIYCERKATVLNELSLNRIVVGFMKWCFYFVLFVRISMGKTHKRLWWNNNNIWKQSNSSDDYTHNRWVTLRGRWLQ
jgi:hypothetical protein